MGTSEARGGGENVVTQVPGYYSFTEAERKLRVPRVLLRFAIRVTGVEQFRGSKGKFVNESGLKALDAWFRQQDPEGWYRVNYGGPRGHRPRPQPEEPAHPQGKPAKSRAATPST